jgi:hypothetical protein
MSVSEDWTVCAGLGTGRTVQARRFHNYASGALLLPATLSLVAPTARHQVADPHQIADRLPVAGLGTGTSAHLVPFQRSTTGLFDGVEPTATHTRADGHETAFSAAVTGTRARTVAPNVAALPVPAPAWAPPALGASRAGPVHAVVSAAVVSTAVTRTPAAASHCVPGIRAP